jgi:hypothetical protein
MATRAKFNVTSITQFQGGSRSVKLGAVTSVWSDEDKSFWNATPSGTIEITISNPDAYELFEVGKPYYVDFSTAE